MTLASVTPLLGETTFAASIEGIRRASPMGYYVMICCMTVGVMVVIWKVLRGWEERGMKLPPGPAGQVPVLGHWLRIGDQITGRRMARLAERYGEVTMLRMGRRRLVLVSSEAAAREVLQVKGVEFGSRASNIVFDVFTGSGQDLAFAEYGPHWRRARRLVTLPFFTSKVIRRWSPAWAHEIDLLLASLSANPDASPASTRGVPLRDGLHFLIYNVMYGVAFGRRFDSPADPLFRELKRLNDERGRLVQNLDYNYADFHPFLLPLLRSYLQTCSQVKIAREKMFKYFISERITNLEKITNSTETRETFGIDLLLASIKSGEMKEEHVLYILENLNSAGIPTMASTVEWAVAELVNNPSIQEKLYEEVVRTIGPEGELRESDCNKLPYLQAVLKETLRFHTTVPLIVPRLNLKPEKIQGYDIPARSKIILNAWWLANNPKYWNAPEKFNPDRFLAEEEGVEVNGNSFKFLPFGSGRRQCPGISMALPLMLLTIGKLVQKYQLLPPPSISIGGKLDLSEEHGQFLNMMAMAPRIIMKRR